eukprot:634802-Pyramimonas_sp.AAC.1
MNSMYVRPGQPKDTFDASVQAATQFRGTPLPGGRLQAATPEHMHALAAEGTGRRRKAQQDEANGGGGEAAAAAADAAGAPHAVP